MRDPDTGLIADPYADKHKISRLLRYFHIMTSSDNENPSVLVKKKYDTTG
jgi:hypothetical protein